MPWRGGSGGRGPPGGGGPCGREGRKVDIRPGPLNGLSHDVLSPETLSHRDRVHLNAEEAPAVPARASGPDADVFRPHGHGPEGDARRGGGAPAYGLYNRGHSPADGRRSRPAGGGRPWLPGSRSPPPRRG